ncbi:MAG: helix-turn-helix domain-containing protein [Syntrophales bacterium]
MKTRKSTAGSRTEQADDPIRVVERMMEMKLEDIATVLCVSGNGKSRLHENVMTMVERSLFRIALNRSGNVRSKAAAYLGVNRNTFQKKLVRLGLDGDPKEE